MPCGGPATVSIILKFLLFKSDLLRSSALTAVNLRTSRDNFLWTSDFTELTNWFGAQALEPTNALLTASRLRSVRLFLPFIFDMPKPRLQ